MKILYVYSKQMKTESVDQIWAFQKFKVDVKSVF